jgi:hypothetical protein
LATTIIRKIPVVLQDLDRIAEQVREGWWYSADDLDSGYWQVKIHEDDVENLGCSAVDPATGKVHYFVWLVLVLGLSDAVRLFTDITAPLVTYCRSRFGLKLSIYIDDLWNGGPTYAAACWNRRLGNGVFLKSGWLFRDTKGRVPSQQQVYLGFIVDTVAMKFRITPDRLEVTMSFLDFLLGRKSCGPRWTSRALPGAQVSCALSLGRWDPAPDSTLGVSKLLWPCLPPGLRGCPSRQR